jgi:hypothetical protein
LIEKKFVKHFFEREKITDVLPNHLVAIAAAKGYITRRREGGRGQRNL